MANRITDSQIEIARLAFLDGKSIPEAAERGQMSVASFKKYCRREIDLMITSKADNESVIENEFKATVDHEFSQVAGNIIKVKDVFYSLKKKHTNYKELIYLREVYEKHLDKLSKPKQSIKVSEPKTLMAQDIKNKSLEQKQKTIKAFKSRFNCHIPIPRKANLQDWDELRMLEHLVFWLATNYSNKSRKEAIELLKQYSDVESRLNYIDTLYCKDSETIAK